VNAADAVGRSVGDVLGPDVYGPCVALLPRAAHGSSAAISRAILCRRAGAEHETVALEVAAWRSPSCDEQLVTIACRDMTARVEAESKREKLEAELRQSQKMEAIGRLSGGVAHDFNNLLTIILGNTEMLEDESGLPEQVRELLAEIRESGTRAADLTKRLLLFSRRQALRPTELDLDDVVEHVLRMLRRVLGEDILIKLGGGAHALTVLADRSLMDQVLLNLAVNARDAMPDGGELTIETAAVELDAETARVRGVGPEGGSFARLTVRDTGCGIAPEALARIFEPFFTTKPVGKGTGLGLATVYGIVEQHGGFVEVESTVGVGTTFHIMLPRLARAAPVVEPGPRLPRAPRGSETILHVEDEAGVRELVRRVLEGHGYRVLQCTTGVNALETWRERRRPIDLVLTDLVMPEGMSGVELGRKLQAEDPRLPIVYTSGYAGTSGVEGSLHAGMTFIAKPYDLTTLLQTIHGALRRRHEREDELS
jgi:hypothetical protein